MSLLTLQAARLLVCFHPACILLHIKKQQPHASDNMFKLPGNAVKKIFNKDLFLPAQCENDSIWYRGLGVAQHCLPTNVSSPLEILHLTFFFFSPDVSAGVFFLWPFCLWNWNFAKMLVALKTLHMICWLEQNPFWLPLTVQRVLTFTLGCERGPFLNSNRGSIMISVYILCVRIFHILI